MIAPERIAKIKALVMDIDGVLTDGRIGYGLEQEIKFFHVRDGHGIKMAQRAGLKVGAISGREAAANRTRATELGFDFIYEGCKKKGEAFSLMLSETGLQPDECLYVGDDVVDVPIFRLAGIAAAVADAPDYLDEYCAFRTRLPGGHGAVREIIDWLLREQDKWAGQMERYLL